jgi:hypothetical protein
MDLSTKVNRCAVLCCAVLCCAVLLSNRDFSRGIKVYLTYLNLVGLIISVKCAPRGGVPMEFERFGMGIWVGLGVSEWWIYVREGR